ncbi:MAG: uroporphyrinogen decarboxylase family protein [Phycisphaerales bacterium]
MKLSSRQRIDAALNHREPDRTPIFEYVLLSPIADILLGRKYAGDPNNWDAIVREKSWLDAVRQSAIDQLDLALLLGWDMLYVVPNRLPPKKYDPFDALRKLNRDDPVEFVRQRNEIASQNIGLADESFLVYECLNTEMDRRDADLPILAPAYAHGIWTDVELMQTMLLAPDVAHQHFALATKQVLAMIDKYFSLRINQFGVGGDFAGNRPMISPQAYREFIVPEVQKLSRKIHSLGGYAINASDGNLWSVIEDFLFGCEVDGYLEIDLHAGMELGKLKALYGGKVTFYGNLDCGNMLSFCSPQEVRHAVIKCIEQGQGNGGHILCASNAVTSSVPFENYIAAVNAYREVFGLAEFNPCKDNNMRL